MTLLPFPHSNPFQWLDFRGRGFKVRYVPRRILGVEQRVRVMSKSVAPRGAGDRLALTDDEIAELVGVALETPIEQPAPAAPQASRNPTSRIPASRIPARKIAKIDAVEETVASSSDEAFLGRRWGLQGRLH